MKIIDKDTELFCILVISIITSFFSMICPVLLSDVPVLCFVLPVFLLAFLEFYKFSYWSSGQTFPKEWHCVLALHLVLTIVGHAARHVD